MSHKVLINWVGGEHEFALGIGQLRAIQEACDAGPEEIFHRIFEGGWRIDDLYEVLRQGLIGSGDFTSNEANKLMARLIDQHPWMMFRAPARSVLAAALIGGVEETSGEPEGAPFPEKNGTSTDSGGSEP
jgi:hypothetical protein